jgi:hypothetical protein
VPAPATHQLTVPMSPEIALDTVHALPTSMMLAGAGILIASTYALRHAFKRYA